MDCKCLQTNYLISFLFFSLVTLGLFFLTFRINEAKNKYFSSLRTNSFGIIRVNDTFIVVFGTVALPVQVKSAQLHNRELDEDCYSSDEGYTASSAYAACGFPVRNRMIGHKEGRSY